MQVEVNETEAVKDTRARSNICWVCGKIGHFYKDCRNPNKRQYQDQMKQKKSLKFKWQMEGEKDFDEEPIEALVSKLIKRGDAYKGKFKKLENAVATGKTITTTTGTKLVMVPKTSANKSNTLVIKVMSPGQTVTKTPKTSPQTSVMKVITGKNQTKKTYSKGLKGTKVSGSNPYGPSENTRSQTKDRRKYTTQAAITSYEKVVVDAIASSSKSEDPDEDVHHISNDEVSDDNEEHLSNGDETNEDQLLQQENWVKPLRKGYSPPKYYSDIELKPFCYNCHERHKVEVIEQVVIGFERGTTFPIDIQGTKCNALIDTGASKSCISEAYFKTLPQQTLKGLHRVVVQSASGNSLAPLGFMTSNITLGNKTFQHDFVVCKHLMRPLILGREFLFKNELKVYYSKTGECRLDHKQEELVATVDLQDELTLSLKSGIHIPGRTVAVLNVNSSVHQNDIGEFYNVRANSLLEDEYPQLQIVPTLHKVDNTNTTLIPFVMIILGEDYIFLPKGQVVGFLDVECIDVSEIELDIATVTVNAMDIPTTIKEKVMKKDQNAISSDFITSPADVAGPRKADLQDFEVTAEETEAFNKLCDKYADVFSDNSGDIGRTPLITMDIDTGENPPVCQRPYTLPLKHADWVKKELNILEAVGIIVRSVSP